MFKKVSNGKWQKLPNGKWKYIKPLKTNGKVNPHSPDYKRTLMIQLRKIVKFCDTCNKEYNMADPCPHHLSDSPEHQAKYKAYLAEQKKKQAQLKDTSDMSNKQERFI